MNNYSGKAVKLTKSTLDLIEQYRNNLCSSIKDFNILKYIGEMSYDKIIHSAIASVLLVQETLGDDYYFIITDERQAPKE